jgi:hypothetical protein
MRVGMVIGQPLTSRGPVTPFEFASWTGGASGASAASSRSSKKAAA